MSGHVFLNPSFNTVSRSLILYGSVSSTQNLTTNFEREEYRGVARNKSKFVQIGSSSQELRVIFEMGTLYRNKCSSGDGESPSPPRKRSVCDNKSLAADSADWDLGTAGGKERVRCFKFCNLALLKIGKLYEADPNE